MDMAALLAADDGATGAAAPSRVACNADDMGGRRSVVEVRPRDVGGSRILKYVADCWWDNEGISGVVSSDAAGGSQDCQCHRIQEIDGCLVVCGSDSE